MKNNNSLSYSKILIGALIKATTFLTLCLIISFSYALVLVELNQNKNKTDILLRNTSESIQYKIVSLNNQIQSLSKVISHTLRLDLKTQKIDPQTVIFAKNFLRQTIDSYEGKILGIGVIPSTGDSFYEEYTGTNENKFTVDKVQTNLDDRHLKPIDSSYGIYSVVDYSNSKLIVIELEKNLYINNFSNKKSNAKSNPTVKIVVYVSEKLFEDLLLDAALQMRYSGYLLKQHIYLNNKLISEVSTFQDNTLLSHYFSVTINSFLGNGSNNMYYNVELFDESLFKSIFFKIFGIMLLGFIMFALNLFISKSRIKLVTIPLEKIINDLEKMDVTKLNSKIPINSDDPQEIYLLRSSLENMRIKVINYTSAYYKAELAAQVAHDIRSPLSVLNLVSKSFSDELKNEHMDLFKLAIKRIQIISDDLLDKKDEYINSHINNSSLKESMFKIIQEKEYLINQSRENIKIVFNSSHSLNFDKLPIQVIERIFSNILNNSVEAFNNSKSGIIEVSLTENNEKTSILIKDNGPGMSPEVLQKVCSKGFTVGKNNGNGLGLYHAKSTIEAAGGLFTITSAVDIGTTVNIVL